MQQTAKQSNLSSHRSSQASLTRLGGQRFCTEALPMNQRLEWLKEIIGKEYANVDITPPETMALYNDMYIYPWQQQMRLSPIQSNAISLERLKQEPTDISQDCYFAVLLTSGRYKLEQGGREVFLKPGEMSFYDATQPHRITIPDKFSKILISIPRPLLDKRLINAGNLTATKLPTKNGIGSVAAAMIESTTQQINSISALNFQQLAMPVLDLFTLLVSEQKAGLSSLSHHQTYALLRVKQFIHLYISESTLNTAMVSEGVGLSVRYINNLFSNEQTSLMRYITQQRLELSRRYLSNIIHRNLSITEIAMQCGFNNMAHFSRIFRQTYGASPREYRRQQLN
ncbi:helix-turn-helix domain-containing protein [Methylophaga thiooxydans]|uniref:helix-turn-helix domain-containing protein n=1 Tax=Methylophaga thiooxydans TaxID=392484 RepID=UPI002356C3CF|nr:helix-turn-helix domain-containing protein [Methylophaga thiooxydans]